MGSGSHALRVGALCCVLALFAARAGAASVLYDFGFFPDAVLLYDGSVRVGQTPLGCSEPVSSSDIAHAYEVCTATDRIADMDFGVAKGYEQTVDGLTLQLSSAGESVDWLFGRFACGNTSNCNPYLADFSTPLSSAQLSILGAEDHGAGGAVTILQSFLEAWSGPGGTGTLLGRVELPGPSGGVLAFTAASGTTIGSLLFGAQTTDNEFHNCGDDGICDNLALVDNLLVTPIPEPVPALLLALGVGSLSRRRSPAQVPARGSLWRGITATSST